MDYSSISLRTVQENDKSFVESLYKRVREEDFMLNKFTIEQVDSFLTMQLNAQSVDYKTNYPTATYQLINLCDQPIGRLILCESKKEIRLLDISILPLYQNKGIGAFILNKIIASAEQKLKLISLHVAVNNPAKKLYERSGFKRISSDGLNDYMVLYKADN